MGGKNPPSSDKINAFDDIYGLVFTDSKPSFHCFQEYSGSTSGSRKSPYLCFSPTEKGWSKSPCYIVSLLQIWFSNI